MVEIHAQKAEPCQAEDEIHRIRLENIQFKCEANYYKAMLARSQSREVELKKRVDQLEAQLRYERQQRFGSTGDTTAPNHSERQSSRAPGRVRKRGQQPGNPPPQRRPLTGMEVKPERVVVPAAQRVCSCCGEPLLEGILEDEIVYCKEIVVKTHVRHIRKERMVRRCRCVEGSRLVTAQVVGPLFPGSQLGVSVWVELLLSRYAEYLPMRRALIRQERLGCQIPAGTVSSSQPRLLELFEPIEKAIATRNRAGTHWHADETPHKVFATIPEKDNHNWWLWVFVGEDTTRYVMHPSRSRQVLIEHLGPQAQGVLSVDRHAAYKAWVKMNICVVLAFCWAHVRRDFIKAATEWPHLATWRDTWIKRIGDVYHANQLRCAGGSEEAVHQAVAAIERAREKEQALPELHPAQRKVLSSLQNHWKGLTLFVDDPVIPMDNNTSERALRMEVVARKAFNGCGSENSAYLLACMATICATLAQHDVDVRTWLTEYLTACAQCGGRAPPDVTRYLPWTFTPTSLAPIADPSAN